MKLLLVVTAAVMSCAASAEAQIKTGRERDGLRGPVRTVRVQSTWAALRGGKYSEGQIGASSTVETYDAAGRKVETAYYNSDGSAGNRLVYTYHPARGVTEIIHYGAGGKPHYKSVRTYDEKGNEVKRADYNRDGSVNGQWDYAYDERRNRTKEVTYRASRVSRLDEYAYTYDAKGNILETRYAYNSQPSRRTVHTYNDEGDVIEMIDYSPDGSIGRAYLSDGPEGDRSFLTKYTYAYEYDSRGNWTKQTTSMWDIRVGGYTPESVIYRTITYY